MRVDAIYDRAALVALPAEMRQGYGKQLQAISQQAPMLLLSFDYEQSLMAGAAFAVAAGEIHALSAFLCAFGAAGNTRCHRARAQI